MSEPEEEPTPLAEPVSQRWQIRNESAGGYRIALEGTREAKVQVGELLGLRHRTDHALWEVGVVRWLRQSAEGSLELGIQVLAPQARPVMVRNEQAGGKAAEDQYALLLPEIPAIKQAASIITPIMLFQPDNELRLQLPGHDIRLKLTQKLQDSGSFVQFLYTSASDQPAQPGPAEDKEGLGSVWDEL